MGTLDKGIRFVIAIAIALVYYFNIITATRAYILIAVAIIFLLTSFINFVLYTPFLELILVK